MATAIPTLRLDVSGTLRFSAVEGVPTSATCVLYDDVGVEHSTPAVTVSGAVLSVTVPAGLADAVADTYRARWTYTAGGEVRVRDQRFMVRRSIAYHTLSSERLVGAYYPVLRQRFPVGVSSWAGMIDAAFDELVNALATQSIDAHKVIDLSPMEPALAALAAYKIAVSGSLGSDVTSGVQAWADDRLAEYGERMRAAVRSLAWYDDNGDLVPNGGETKLNAGRLRLTR